MLKTDEKFHFQRFAWKIDKSWMFFLPTIYLMTNDYIYIYPNFRIEIHFLMFHAMWFWGKWEKEDKE